MTARRANAAGFTLLELLVVLAVLGLLLAGLAQVVRYGLLAWGTEARMVGARDQLDAADRALRQLIGNMEDDSGVLKPTWLAGQPNRFDFTTRLPRVVALATRRADVALFVDSDHRLMLRWAPHLHETPFAAPPPAAETELLAGVERVEFSYWRGAGRKGLAPGWQHAWTDPAPPDIVKVHLVFAKRDGRSWPDIVVARALGGGNG
jgi:general secretion pathway protein J